ncbi:MAG: U32 family peptidase [Clostridia bacterium]|nr:U32 family peptidase [Clostridia bacterium]
MKNNIELLCPVGNFDCLKAAVQNGADAVYLGASNFSARASATNFSFEELKQAIEYAHIRDVKVHLALNTLIKNNELDSALSLASYAYEIGVDAIIVQDLGLAKILIKSFPKLPIHASTQMTIHNLEGVVQAERLGFSRVILSRELSLEEINYISRNSNIEIECFVHGALCISYSGQCLFSSMVGGRSANRGKCAQACRLPYELLEDNETVIDKGYLLSPRDLCGLDNLGFLIEAGITSLKIEGRLKSPEYVATVTRIYRKYIDLYLKNGNFTVDEKDRIDLLQVFNRGGFSSGHFNDFPNKDLIFKDKSNNMGIYVGNVANFDSNKGHIKLNLADSIEIGDTITFEKENTRYTVSELMIENSNIRSASTGQIVTIGRMKGNIHLSDKIYKLSSKSLSDFALKSYQNVEIKKILLACKIIIKKDSPVIVKVKAVNPSSNYQDIIINITSDIYPVESINQPITEEKIIEQFKKTGNTPYEFIKFDIDLDNNLYIPKISSLNALRRDVLKKLEDSAIKHSIRVSEELKLKNVQKEVSILKPKIKKTSLLLNILNLDFDYNNLQDVDRIYIPIKYFSMQKYENILTTITSRFITYIYMPTITTTNYKNIFMNSISSALSKYKIKGFVISNLAGFTLLKEFKKDYDFIGNYTLNVFNDYTASELNNLGISTITLSPELNKLDIENICNGISSELIVYGNTPLMNIKYCLFGTSNQCYPECSNRCNSSHKYYLKDRMGFSMRVLPDNIQTITTIYNAKITSLACSDLNIDYSRIDIIDEDINTINHIIETTKNGERLEGVSYTNGNITRNV